MNRVKCIVTHGRGWSGCMSPGACRDWGYCRQRNIDAGGMKSVTPAMQAQWRKEDAPDPEPA